MYTVMIKLYSLIGLGYALRRSGVFSEEMIKRLTDLVIYLTLPSLTLSSMLGAPLSESVKAMMDVIQAAIYLHVVMFMISMPITWVILERRDEMFITAMLATIGNAIFLPLPIVESLWGSALVPFVVTYGFIGIAFGNTLGAFLASMASRGEIDLGERLLRMAKFPPFISVIVAILLLIARVEIPSEVLSAMGYVGMPTSYVVMLIMGALLADLKGNELSRIGKGLAVVLVLRFIISPLLMMMGMSVLKPEPHVLRVVIVESIMPPAITNIVIAAEFGAEESYVATLVLLSTICSLITIWMIPTLEALLIS